MEQRTEMTCEEFYFRYIVPVEASPEQYRRFFDLLWRTHAEMIHKHAFARLGNFEDARDICQDAFLRAMKFIQSNPGRIPLKVNFRAWLRKIARRLIYDRFRKPMIRRERQSAEPVEPEPVEEAPEDRLARAEDLAVLNKCLGSLTDRARKIVILRDVEGQSQQAVAEAIGSNPNAVGVALHRARKSLRECMAMSMDAEGPPHAAAAANTR